MKLFVWTECYRPFIMGGDVHAPCGTEVEVGEPVDLGRGVKVYVVASPKGTVRIAEAKSGAFVGDDLETVKRDMAEADLKVVKKQIADAIARRDAKAQRLPPEEFFRLVDPRPTIKPKAKKRKAKA